MAGLVPAVMAGLVPAVYAANASAWMPATSAGMTACAMSIASGRKLVMAGLVPAIYAADASAWMPAASAGMTASPANVNPVIARLSRPGDDKANRKETHSQRIAGQDLQYFKPLWP